MIIGQYEIQTPLLNGGGLVKTVEDARQMADTDVGAVVAASYTMDERAYEGTSKRTHVDADTGVTYSFEDLTNPGLKYLENNLQEMVDTAHERGKPFVLGIAPVTADPREEVGQMGKLLAHAGVIDLDAIELNATSALIPRRGGRKPVMLSQDPHLLGQVILDMKDMATELTGADTIITRLAPFGSPREAREMGQVLYETDIDAVAAFDLFPSSRPGNKIRNGIRGIPSYMGYMSGPALRYDAEVQARWLAAVREHVGGRFDIIGATGISSGESMHRRLKLGASAVSATTVFYQASSWREAAATLLREYEEVAEYAQAVKG